LDRARFDVIEHPRVFYSKTVLGPVKTAQPLDTALAEFCRLVSEVEFDRISNGSTEMGGQPTKLLNRAWCEENLEPHSGQSLARMSRTRKSRANTGVKLRASNMLNARQLQLLVLRHAATCDPLNPVDA
jgi:hypothetical protein